MNKIISRKEKIKKTEGVVETKYNDPNQIPILMKKLDIKQGQIDEVNTKMENLLAYDSVENKTSAKMLEHNVKKDLEEDKLEILNDLNFLKGKFPNWEDQVISVPKGLDEKISKDIIRKVEELQHFAVHPSNRKLPFIDNSTKVNAVGGDAIYQGNFTYKHENSTAQALARTRGFALGYHGL